MSDPIGNKVRGLSETRAWALAYAKVKRADAVWGDLKKRSRALDEAKRFLALQQVHPRLARLSRLVHVSMDRRDLWSVLVPLERVASRTRITDADFLTDCRDKTEQKPLMPATVVLDSLRSALNTGGILRICECFGFEETVLCGYTADITHPRVQRSAMGAERLVRCTREADICTTIRRLQGEGKRVVALETRPTATHVDDYIFEFPGAIVLGNERFGVMPSALALCDGVVSIPMFGRKNSLNVGSAFAICAQRARVCFEALREHDDA